MDTQTIQQQYERALARATAEGIRIVGESAYEGNRSWSVENPSHDGHYTVRLAVGASELTCNCPTHLPAYCKHRSLVHQALEREAHRERPTIHQPQAERKAALAQPRHLELAAAPSRKENDHGPQGISAAAEASARRGTGDYGQQPQRRDRRVHVAGRTS